DQDKPDSKSNHGLQLNITYDLSDSLRFTSITGSRYSDSYNFLDMDNRATGGTAEVLPPYGEMAPLPVTSFGATLEADVSQTFTSQEFRLEQTGPQLHWLAGLYVFRQEQDQRRRRQAGAGVATTFPAAFYIYDNYFDTREGSA